MDITNDVTLQLSNDNNEQVKMDLNDIQLQQLQSSNDNKNNSIEEDQNLKTINNTNDEFVTINTPDSTIKVPFDPKIVTIKDMKKIQDVQGYLHSYSFLDLTGQWSAYYFNEDYKIMNSNDKIIKGKIIQLVICRVSINMNNNLNIDICWPSSSKNQDNDKKAVHYIQAGVGATFWNKAEWFEVSKSSDASELIPPISEKGSYKFSNKQRIEDLPLNVSKLKIWPNYCSISDSNDSNESTTKKNVKPLVFEICPLPREIQTFSLKVNTFFHNSLNNNQLSLQVSFTNTIKVLKNEVMKHIKIIETDETDKNHSWTGWTLNIFDEYYSTVYDEDHLELRDCLKSDMTINVVINRISLDGFPKIDDIRWPPISTDKTKSMTTTSVTGEAFNSTPTSSDEVVYFVSAGYQGNYVNSYTGWPPTTDKSSRLFPTTALSNMNPPTWYKVNEVGIYYKNTSIQLVGLKESIYSARIWVRVIKKDQASGNSSDYNPKVSFEIRLPDSKVTARELKKDEKHFYSLECRWFDGVYLLQNIESNTCILEVKIEILKKYLSSRTALDPNHLVNNLVAYIFNDNFTTLFSYDKMKIADLPLDPMTGNAELKFVNVVICHTLQNDDDSFTDYIFCPKQAGLLNFVQAGFSGYLMSWTLLSSAADANTLTPPSSQKGLYFNADEEIKLQLQSDTDQTNIRASIWLREKLENTNDTKDFLPLTKFQLDLPKIRRPYGSITVVVNTWQGPINLNGVHKNSSIEDIMKRDELNNLLKLEEIAWTVTIFSKSYQRLSDKDILCKIDDGDELNLIVSSFIKEDDTQTKDISAGGGSSTDKSDTAGQWCVNIRWPKYSSIERDSDLLYFIEARNERISGADWTTKLPRIENNLELLPPDPKSCGIFTTNNIISNLKVPGSATRARILLRRKRYGNEKATESFNSKEGKLDIQFIEVGMVSSATTYYQENKGTIARYLRLGATGMTFVPGFQGDVLAVLLNLAADTIEGGKISNGSMKAVLNQAIDSMPDKYKQLKDASKTLISTIKVDDSKGQVSDWGSFEEYKKLSRLLFNDEQNKTFNLLQVTFTSIHDMLSKLVLAIDEKDHEKCNRYMIECRVLATTSNTSLGEIHIKPVASSVVPFLSIFANDETRKKLENATGTIEDYISKIKVFFTCFVSIIENLKLYEVRAALAGISLSDIKETLANIVNLLKNIKNIANTDTNALSTSIVKHIMDTKELAKELKFLCEGIKATSNVESAKGVPRLPESYVGFVDSLNNHCDAWLSIVSNNNLAENVKYFVSLLKEFRIVETTTLCASIIEHLLLLTPKLQNIFQYMTSASPHENGGINLDEFNEHLEAVSIPLSNLLDTIFGPLGQMHILRLIMEELRYQKEKHKIVRNILKSIMKIDDDSLDSNLLSFLDVLDNVKIGITDEIMKSYQMQIENNNSLSKDAVLSYIKYRMIPFFYLRSKYGDISKELLSLNSGFFKIQNDVANKRIHEAINDIKDFCNNPFKPKTLKESTIANLVLLKVDGRYVLEVVRGFISKSMLSDVEYNEEGKRDHHLDEKLNKLIQGTEEKLKATMDTVSLLSSQDARKEKAKMIAKFIFGVITLTGSISLFSAILSRLVRGDYIESSNDGFVGSRVMIPLALPFASVFGVASFTASFIYRSVIDITDNFYPDTPVLSFCFRNSILLFLLGFLIGIIFEYGAAWMEILGITTLIVSGTILTIHNAISLKKSLTVTKIRN